MGGLVEEDGEVVGLHLALGRRLAHDDAAFRFQIAHHFLEVVSLNYH